MQLPAKQLTCLGGSSGSNPDLSVLSEERLWKKDAVRD